jgi:hypothetical protein
MGGYGNPTGPVRVPSGSIGLAWRRSWAILAGDGMTHRDAVKAVGELVAGLVTARRQGERLCRQRQVSAGFPLTQRAGGGTMPVSESVKVLYVQAATNQAVRVRDAARPRRSRLGDSDNPGGLYFRGALR